MIGPLKRGITTPHSTGAIVGIAVAILIVLFSIQQFGTSKIGYAFAPIMCTFFIFNSGIGIYNIFKYQPGIFKVRCDRP